MRTETYKYTTKKGSEVYHILNPKWRWWLIGRYAICGKHFWLYEGCMNRPKGKHLCKNCKKIMLKRKKALKHDTTCALLTKLASR